MTVFGTRPEAIKMCPLVLEMQKYPDFIEPIVAVTAQHREMLDQVLQLFAIKPDYDLNIMTAGQTLYDVTGRALAGLKDVLAEAQPDMVLVHGDTTTTFVGALASFYAQIPVGHVEAGLRTGNKFSPYPEEMNRKLTGAIADIHFAPTSTSKNNLLKENIPAKKIHMLGNLMIDSLVEQLPKAGKTELKFDLLNRDARIEIGNDFRDKEYGVMTFHRPGNVDDRESLTGLVKIWGKISERVPLVFPVHPRTYKNIQRFDLQKAIDAFPHLYFIEPLGYLQFIHLVSRSMFTLTDSGGIQEETTYLGIPCLTVRPTTERPVTIWEGTNSLIKVQEIEPEVNKILSGKGKKGNVPKYWDGKTAERIVQMLMKET